MTDQQVFQKIADLYANSKSLKFIEHLLRSFFPQGKASFMLSPNNKKMVCAITGVRLYTKQDHLGLMVPAAGLMLRDTSARYLAEAENREYVQDPELTALIEKGRAMPLALTTQGSDKLLCQQAYEQLYNFYATRLLQGDKHINWVAKNERAKETVNNFREKNYNLSGQEEKLVRKVMEKPSGQTLSSSNGLSLGDFDALKSLKAKLEGGK